MRQAGRYLTHAAFVVVLSVGMIWAMPAAFYNQWAGYLSISAIPMMAMLNIFTNRPAPEAQPTKGLRMLLLTVLAGAIVAPVALIYFQGNLATPSIVAMMFVIYGVVCIMWLALVFEGWPASWLVAEGWWRGLAAIVLAYVLGWLTYPLLFDFTAFGLGTGAPTGAFQAWPVIVYLIMTLGVIFALLLFEQMPLKVAARWPQPVSGLVTTLVILLLSGALMALFTRMFGMDVVSLMVMGPISFMFGVFMITDVSQNMIFSRVEQPVRGWLLLAASIATGGIMYVAYSQVMQILAPGMPQGAPTYMAELWLANAMLSITFPVILIHIHFFDGWPLARYKPERVSDTIPESTGLPVKPGLK